MSAVTEAMGRLKLHGFIAWHRRTRPIDNPEPGGQYVEQISNAYYFTLPANAAELVRRMLRRPTEIIRRAAEQRRRADRLNAMDSDAIIAGVKDPEMAELLRSLRSKLVEGESARRSE